MWVNCHHVRLSLVTFHHRLSEPAAADSHDFVVYLKYVMRQAPIQLRCAFLVFDPIAGVVKRL
jgi:hypothetical protein